MDRKELQRILDAIISGCETKSPEGRKEAFERCLDYAEQHLGSSLECNLFLAWAAERLGQSRVLKRVVQEMVERSENARLHVGYQPDWGMVLTGNPEGLKYLSELLSLLSESPVEGEFVEMEPEDEELCGDSFGMVAFREADEWFEQMEEDQEFQEEDSSLVLRKGLDASKVLGVQFLADPPPSFNLRRNRLYLVKEVKKRTGEDIYEKLIREDTDKLWVFAFHDDNYELVKMALDLQDPEINFLTRADMEQIIQ
jgi:hypothetical protein